MRRSCTQSLRGPRPALRRGRVHCNEVVYILRSCVSRCDRCSVHVTAGCFNPLERCAALSNVPRRSCSARSLCMRYLRRHRTRFRCHRNAGESCPFAADLTTSCTYHRLTSTSTCAGVPATSVRGRIAPMRSEQFEPSYGAEGRPGGCQGFIQGSRRSRRLVHTTYKDPLEDYKLRTQEKYCQSKLWLLPLTSSN
jgi:hypothetical protein